MGQRDDLESDDPEREEQIRRAESVRAENLERLRRFPNVVGTGVGFKEVRGEVTPRVALRVYVARKLPLEDMAPEDILPLEIDGIPVDVLVAPVYCELLFRRHWAADIARGNGISSGNC